MKPYGALLFALSIFVCSACSSKTPDTLIQGGYDEKEMEEATARAQKEVDAFIDELSKGAGVNFAVKAPITDGKETEHFWLSDVVYRNGEFEGKIANDPGMVSNVKMGQKWTIKKGEISDWMFMRNEKIHGNYTMRPLLKTMPKEQAEKFKSMLANP
jgi:uncharacterized protein YegJ (DUF2314 family)